MDKPTFSIVIPTYNRVTILSRALNSLYSQTYDKDLYEIIIVDDGSIDNTQEALDDLLKSKPRFPELIIHTIKVNQGRVAARNKGMELATKEWICWLDSDDEMVSTYLEVYAKAIQENPGTDIFTAGTVVHNEQTLQSGIRNGFMPRVRADGRGCDLFKSGGVSTGGFVFKRRLAARIHIPGEARSPYGGDDSFPALVTKTYPELETLYGKNSSGQWLPLGNPWGDDYIYFFALTRNNIPIKINYAPYIQHVRHE